MSSRIILAGALLGCVALGEGSAHAQTAAAGSTLAEPKLGMAVAEENTSVDSSDEAEAAFRNGARAFERGEAAHALVLMKKAFRLRPDYRTAAGVGQVELHLGRHRDAAQHLEFALRHYPKSADADGRGRLIEGFKLARGRVGTLTLEAQLTGAKLAIDGKLVGILPLAFDLFVDAGTHQVVFEKSGFAANETSVTISEGELLSLKVELGPALPPTVVTTEPKQRSNSRATSGADWLLLSGGVLAVGALGTGAILSLDADSTQARAEKLRAQLGQSCEPASTDSDCELARSALSDARSRHALASGLFVGAAAVAVLSVGLYSWLGYTPTEEHAENTVSLLPEFDVASAGLRLWGTFQ